MTKADDQFEEQNPIVPVSSMMPKKHIELDERQRLAKAMAASTMLPKCLHGKNEMQTIANMLAVQDVAERWQMSPWQVAGEAYEVGGKISYQGKLIAAVVNSIGGLAKRLNYEYTGEGDGRTVTVIGTIRGEDEPRTVELNVGQAKTANQMWAKDPDQKLCYSGSIRWARRHMPELVLGVVTSEEIEDSCNSINAEITQQQNYQRDHARKKVREAEITQVLQEQTTPVVGVTGGQAVTAEDIDATIAGKRRDGQLFDDGGMPVNVQD